MKPGPPQSGRRSTAQARMIRRRSEIPRCTRTTIATTIANRRAQTIMQVWNAHRRFSYCPGERTTRGISASVQSAAPYSETIGEDVYHNARGNARRAGVGRNTLQGSAFAELDLRVSRDLGFASGTSHARTLSVSVDTFNVLNRINYGTYIGTLGSPLFGQPITARAPRQIQLSAHLKF